MATLQRRELRWGRRPALLIVDASRAFTDPDCPLGGDFHREIEAITRLLAVFRARRLPVFFTTNVFADKAHGSVFREKLPDLDLLEAGSGLVEINPMIAPAPPEPVIQKAFPSAFFETPLRSFIQSASVDSVVIAGFTTSGCVRASAVDALSCNLRVVLASDAVGDRDLEAHKANLHDIDAKYGQVRHSDQVIHEIDEIRAWRDR